ncbi:MAG: Uncharacterized protein CEN89_597 [Candidatus Berkelbacteria bacterium Licking1014_7]|uniref:RiboL-PSP-HEPN domain-containing protein n=1 Tax=Candidatus Berkelbacteria bacterium Licking1014_7 TaxID=2017147 RepID=A0A554LIC7_9BACT|nr:MAG: Uncharacterized protein CEN89_597 [Candidatus Berkelbacteria bacterium Licking1014_7]
MIMSGLGKIIVKPFVRIFKPSAVKKIAQKEFQDEFKRLWGVFQLGDEAHFRQAITEADNFLDKVLKSQNFSGKTLGERLKLAGGKMAESAYQAAWNAHKVRNRIVHESDFALLSFQTKKTLNDFEKAIKELIK